MPPCQLHASMRFRELAEQTDSRNSVVRDVPLAHPQHNFQQMQGIRLQQLEVIRWMQLQ